MRRVLTAAMVVAALVGGAEASAQTSCSTSTSCAVNFDATVVIQDLVTLDIGIASMNLTSPTPADFGGSVDDTGPTLTVTANRTWSLQVHTSAATNWSYTGPNAGVKPVGDLTWSMTSGSGYVPITGTAADIATLQPATNSYAQPIYFRTNYAAGAADPSNAPGTYTIPLVFTITAS